MKKKCDFKIIGDIVVTIILILSFIVTLFALITNKDGIPNVNGYSPFSIQSNSMYPTLKKGDMIITDNNIDINSLKKGDIISFYAYEENTNIIKTHRIENIVQENNARFFETKGDNNDIQDKVFITDIDIIGKYKFRIPVLGRIIDILKNKWVFFSIVLIPLTILFIYQLVAFISLLIDYKIDKEED